MILAIIILVVILFLLFSYFQNKKWKKKIGNLNASRPILPKKEYIELLIKKGFKKEHIEIVYDVILPFVKKENFSMYP